MLTPAPVAKSTVCSVCGLDWDRHKIAKGAKAPKVDECVQLLKMDLAASASRYRQGYILTTGPSTALGYGSNTTGI